jgi:hypothetical protein
MHIEAYNAIGRMLDRTNLHLQGSYVGLDVGGRNVNGSAREWLPNTRWRGLDVVAGPDVDIVADASTWVPNQLFDVVMTTELFEHTPRWREIIAVMASALEPRGPGIFLSTCASIGRPMHGASGEPTPPPGEWYQNVDHVLLKIELEKHFHCVEVEYQPLPGDAYALATCPRRSQCITTL